LSAIGRGAMELQRHVQTAVLSWNNTAS